MDRIERSAAVETAIKTLKEFLRMIDAGEMFLSDLDDDLLARMRKAFLPPARFMREDVEKAAAEVFKITWKRECYNGVTLRDVDRYRNNGPDSMGGRVERYEAESVEIATAALSAIGDVDHG